MAFVKIDEKSARRPDGTNCVLVYGYGKHNMEMIAKTAAEAGIDGIVHVEKSHLGHIIMNLLDNVSLFHQSQTSEPMIPYVSDMPKTDNEPVAATALPFTHDISDPVVVMSALSDTELTLFMNKFRTLGLEKPLFAVVTPTTIHWRFGDLALELGKERSEIEKRKKS
jgi:hypothetical protein